MDISFKNPANGYVEKTNFAGLWCFLFGPLYFIAKGVWSHAIISLVIAPITCGLSWLIYPFFAAGVIQKHYLRKGWLQV